MAEKRLKEQGHDIGDDGLKENAEKEGNE